MNEEVITSPKIPRRFRITKIFLYIVLIAAFCKTLRGITGTVLSPRNPPFMSPSQIPGAVT